MKRLITLAVFMLCVLPAMSQTPTPPAPGAPTAPAKVEVISKAKTPADAEQEARLKAAAELAESKQETASARAQVLQGQFDAAMKQQMGPLQADYEAKEKIITDYSDFVKKQNGWGDDVALDKATMKFYRTPKPVAAPAVPPADSPVAK